MRTILNLFFLHTLKKIVVITLAFSLSALSTTSFATVINFDELDPVFDEVSPCWCDNPLYDQYFDKGLLIHDAWVVGSKPNNNMLTSNFSTLEFVGELPTFVSMDITSIYGDAILLDIYGPSGFLFSRHTAGWMGPEEDFIPPITNELISFSSDTGVSFITIQGFYNMRLGASIDNIIFINASVPEPASIALIALGLFGIMVHRHKFNANKIHVN